MTTFAKSLAIPLLAISLLTISSGCCRRPKIEPTTIRTVRVACLKEKPPSVELEPGDILRAGESFCPVEAKGGCYSVEAAEAIAAKLRYADRAWIKCRPKTDDGPTP